MRDIAINLILLLGAGLVVYGLGLAWLPAGIVAAGLALILAAVAIARANESGQRTHR